jgi:hypothetical protein
MRYFPPAKHIRVRFGGYWHHGVTHHDGRAIHFSGLNVEEGKRAASVRWTTPERFAGGRGVDAIEIVEHVTNDPEDVILARAESLLARGSYNAWSNNCEHAAYWAVTGIWLSDQVEGAKAAGIGVAGAAGGSAMAVSVATAAGASGAGIMESLAGAGAVVGGGAPAGVVMLAAGPAIAATVAVRHAYRDDPTLPTPERGARASARTVGTVGAVGTMGGTLALISALGVPGLSGPGIATGLVGIGGSMLGGVVVAAVAPVAVAVVAARVAFLLSRRRRGLA